MYVFRKCVQIILIIQSTRREKIYKNPVFLIANKFVIIILLVDFYRYEFFYTDFIQSY